MEIILISEGKYPFREENERPMRKHHWNRLLCVFPTTTGNSYTYDIVETGVFKLY